MWYVCNDLYSRLAREESVYTPSGGENKKGKRLVKHSSGKVVHLGEVSHQVPSLECGQCRRGGLSLYANKLADYWLPEYYLAV